MIVFRLAKSRYAMDLSGHGAELSGGRWNYKGTRMLYTSDSRALCTTEIAVHVPMGIIPEDYKLVTIEIPDEMKFDTVHINKLPRGWNRFPYAHQTRKIGEAFIKKGMFLMLKVPSAVVQGDYNYLINPGHPEFKRIKIVRTEDFHFDSRFFRR